MMDAQTYCGQFIPNRVRVAHCLIANRRKISPACREAVKHFLREQSFDFGSMHFTLAEALFPPHHSEPVLIMKVPQDRNLLSFVRLISDATLDSRSLFQEDAMKTRTMLALASLTVATMSLPVVGSACREVGPAGVHAGRHVSLRRIHSQSRTCGDMPDIESRPHLAGLPQRAGALPSANRVGTLTLHCLRTLFRFAPLYTAPLLRVA